MRIIHRLALAPFVLGLSLMAGSSSGHPHSAAASSSASVKQCIGRLISDPSNAAVGSDVLTSGAIASLAELTPEAGSETLKVGFGSNRDPQVRTITFKATEALSVDPSGIRVYVLTDLTRGDSAAFPKGQITFQAGITPDMMRLQVAICLDPAHPNGVAQGEYTGSIVVSGAGLTISPVPADITLRYAPSSRAWMVAFVGALLGLMLKVLTDTTKRVAPAPAGGSAPSGADQGTWKNIRAHVMSAQFLANVIVGGIVSVTAVFYTYAGNATFGASLGDWLGLTAVGFTAMIGGATLTDAGSALLGT
jgi:hypothetical protein